MEDAPCNDDGNDTWQPLWKVTAAVLSKTNKLAAQLPSCVGINRSGLFLSGESPEDNEATGDADFSEPSTVPASINTLQARSRYRLTVVAVLSIGGLSKIDEPVVRLEAVNMVDDYRGPATMNMQPNKPMGGIFDATNNNAAVASSDESSGAPNQSPMPECSPDEITGIRRVIEEFADTFRSNRIIEVEHDLETHEKHAEHGKRNEAKNDQDVEKSAKRDEQQRAYVDQRLRELRAFE